jgi:hypothetical protein
MSERTREANREARSFWMRAVVAETKITAAINAINDHIGNPDTEVDLAKRLLAILGGIEDTT